MSDAIDNLKAYIGACVTVAQMHAAAMGEVCGPKRGVVEDIADLRTERDEWKRRAELWERRFGRAFEALKKCHSLLGTRHKTLFDELTAIIHDECTTQAFDDLAASGGIAGAP